VYHITHKLFGFLKPPTRDRGHRHEALDLLVVCDHRLTTHIII